MSLPATASVLPAHACLDDQRPTCRIVIVYEDRATLDRACLLYQKVKDALDNDLNFECARWRLDTIERPADRMRSAHEAERAHVIIFSIHGDGGPSAFLREWINAWLPEKSDKDIALVALLDERSAPKRGTVEVRDWLEEIALDHGVDFFAEFVRPSGCRHSRIELNHR